MAGGVREASWPSLRRDLSLSYFQLGFLLGIPAILSGFIDALTGVLADLGRRRLLVTLGGALFAASLLLTAVSPGFWLLLLSFVLFSPASGAFVNIAQAELMDREPNRRDQNMARWTFAGSIGALAGPLVLGAAAWFAAGWRAVFLAIAVLSAAVLLLASRAAFPKRGRCDTAEAASALGPAREMPPRFREILRGMGKALRKPDVIRWLLLLEIANLMLDVLFGFLALYFVEVASVTIGQAALAVMAWTAAEVLGDLLLIPILERMDGLAWLRVSAVAAGALYPCFLLAGPFGLKLVLVVALGLARAGWYSILQARLYAALPGRSGVAIALGTLTSSASALIPVGLGALAEAAGLGPAMWVLMAAPLTLLVAVPRSKSLRPSGGPGRRRR